MIGLKAGGGHSLLDPEKYEFLRSIDSKDGQARVSIYRRLSEGYFVFTAERWRTWESYDGQPDACWIPMEARSGMFVDAESAEAEGRRLLGMLTD
jgi:hypothetical protein